jgi:hypothetical protein
MGTYALEDLMWDKILNTVLDPRVVAGFLALCTAVVVTVKQTFFPKKTANDPLDPHAGNSVFRKDAPLAKHYVFKILKDYRNIISGRFMLDNTAKTEAFRDFLIHYIDISGDQLYRLAKYLDRVCLKENCTGTECEIAGVDLMTFNKEVFTSILELYQSYYKLPDCGYSDADREVLDFVKDVFNKYHALGFNFIKATIDCSFTNTRYSDCARLIQTHIFTGYEAVYSNLLLGTEDALRNTNGFFEKHTFSKRSYSLPEWYSTDGGWKNG